ncbi:MAG: hypothetical protein U1E51_35450, partial [Candidatus Binatia bacterium]|nr:hypothetical protein [Candidatus Binatia bacterium]
MNAQSRKSTPLGANLIVRRVNVKKFESPVVFKPSLTTISATPFLWKQVSKGRATPFLLSLRGLFMITGTRASVASPHKCRLSAERLHLHEAKS